MLDLSGRVAIVTGGARGIGRAIALRLAAQGADVGFSYRGNDAAARATTAEIEALGRRALAVRADVTCPDDAERVVTETLAAFGRLDIVVNNAGITSDHLIAFMTDEAWTGVLETNLSGAFYTLRAAVAAMTPGGRIVNIGSVSGLHGNAGQANYSASKAGLAALTQSAARELGPRGITCNAVAPGLVTTELTDEMPVAAHAALERRVALGRSGTADEVAAAVAFFASDEAAYVTGQVLAIDGGIAP